MKIYCILCDAMPYSENLVTLAKDKEASFLHQISNAFTQSSVLSLITGQRPSDILDNGFGWKTGEKAAVKDKNLKWSKNNFIHSAINHNEWNVNYHNSTWLYDYLYNDTKINETSNYPGGLSKEKVSAWDDLHHIVLGTDKNADEFYNQEKAMIDKFQRKSNMNELYFITYQPHHAAIATNPGKINIASDRLLDLLSHYDWNEPDSLFIVFADHGDFRFVDKYCTPPHPWLTWSIVKDNITSCSVSKNLINIKDLYTIISNKISGNINKTYLQDPNDSNEIFFMEDGRSHIDPYRSTTAAAIKAIGWYNDTPIMFSQLSYHLPEKRFIPFTYNRTTGFITQADVDKDLKTALINTYTWIE